MRIYVNHYNPGMSSALRAMTLFCVGCFVENSDLEHQVTVLDGSGVRDRELEGSLLQRGVRYMPSESAESFAATYNRGLVDGSGFELVLAANDIFVPKHWDSNLLESVSAKFEGMIIPYLSSSAYRTQELRSAYLRRPIDPILCTLNLNYLTANVTGKIGVLDESYSGSYNDIDYMLRMRSKGLRVVMRDIGPVKHLGKMTVSKSTSWVPVKDKTLFSLNYPKLKLKGWWLNPSKRELCKSFLLRQLFKCFLWLPSNLRAQVFSRIIALEVFFNREKPFEK